MNDAQSPLVRPLTGPACWTPASLKPHEWIYTLSSPEADELKRCADAFAGREPRTLKVSDIQLPNVGPRLKQARRVLLEGAGLFLIKGLPVDDGDESYLSRMLWAIGTYLGIAQPQDAAGALIHHVRDTGVSVAGRDNIRTFQTNEAQPWHNDGGDLFALLCAKTANTGGRSLLASAYTVFNTLLARDPELVRTLQAPFHFDARGQQLPGAGRVQKVPIYTWHAGRMYLLHKRHYIDHAQRFEEVPRLTDAQHAALDAFEELCEDPAIHLAFDLEPGDLELGHNFSLLHRRDAFDVSSDAVSERHLLRLWLGAPDGWPLPEVYRTTREYGPLFALRDPLVDANRPT